MSLITDQDYFLQSLRLAFLRLDTPIAAHSTAHLVQSPPAHALSLHALHAGLTTEQLPDLGLASSPGPVPSTSSGLGVGVASRVYNTSAAASTSAAGIPASRASKRASRPPGGLKHSETIVGRHGEKSAGTGAAAGLRVKGKRTHWRPKSHHFLQAESSASNTPRPNREADSTFPGSASLEAHPLQGGPQFEFASPDRTPMPSRRPSVPGIDDDPESEGEEYDEEEDDSTDEEVDNASSDTEDGLQRSSSTAFGGVAAQQGGPFGMLSRADAAGAGSLAGPSSAQRPNADRSLSEAIAQSNMQGSATETDTASMSASASASISASQLDGDTLDDGTASSASLVGGSAGPQSSSHFDRSVPRRRARKQTLESSDAPSLEDTAGDSDEEEDEFQFSLPGHEGSSHLGIESPSHASNALAVQNGGVTTFVSPPNNSALPSIAEAAETNDSHQASVDGTPSLLNGPVDPFNLSEDAALKAAQSARRRARRRVNISGRMPLKLDIPPSPEQRNGDAGWSSGPQILTIPGSGIGAGTRSPPTDAASAPGTPNSARSAKSSGDIPFRPMSPAHFALSPLRTKSGRIITTRQRAKTDPAPPSAFSSPLSSPRLPRTRSSDSQHPIHDLAPPTPRMADGSRTRSLSGSPLTTARPYTTEPHLPLPSDLDRIPLPRRARSTGANENPLPFQPIAADSGRTSRSASPIATKVSAGDDPSIRPALSPHRGASKPHHHHHHDPYLTFPITKKQVPQSRAPGQSALSVMLRQEQSSSSSAGNNPFNELYGALFAPTKPAPAGPARRFGPPRDDPSTFTVTMYYPFSRDAAKPIKMSLKPDAIVEEVLGCALWKYWESQRKPSLLANAEGANDETWHEQPDETKAKVLASSYVLRIADEDEDGEVDDDFPAPERVRPAKGFGSCFAVVLASTMQARQNQATDNQIQRRPSRIIKRLENAAKPTISPQTSTGNLAPPSATTLQVPTPAFGGMSTAGSLISASFAGTPSKASFAGGATGPLVLVRIRIPLRGVEDVTTAVKVPLDAYLADVLEMLCKKRNLGSPKDWILVVPDRGIVVPLDRTVESLQGTYNLALQRKSNVPGLVSQNGPAKPKGGMQNTNPNASIFKRLSEPPQPKYVTSADLYTNYRSYVVQRKMPMPLGRHERVLSLDNDYIHIMPSETKLASGTVRTASYHISQVAACKTSKRAPSSFKLIVWRNKDRDVKRYDFEAANGRMATEIAQTIQALMQAYKEGVERELMAT